MAYLELVKAGGRTYAYVTEYRGEIDFSSRKENRIVRLGNVQNALKKLEMWAENKALIPQSIDKKDYHKINDWKEKVKLKIIS